MTKKSTNGTLTKRYKKQHGMHHKQSGKYLKVYWPFIPVIFFILAGVTSSIFVLATKNTSSGSTSNISINNLLSDTNQLRQTSNLQPLNLNTQLDKAAQLKANDMAVKNYWSAKNPEGQTISQLVQSTGYLLKSGGDNLAYGFSSASNLISAWLGSSSHKANILNNTYTDVGFGVVNSPDFQGKGPTTIVVAIYGSPGGSGVLSNNIPGQINFADNSASSQTVVKANTLLKNHSSLISFIVGSLLGILICYLVVKNLIVIKKWLVEGEDLVVKHPYLDFIILIIIVGLIIINQTVGVIG